MKKSTSFDPRTGFREEFHFDEQTNKATIYREQDVEGQLKANREAYNSHGKRSGGGECGGARHVARIPLVVIERWKTEGFDWFNSTTKEKRAKLNDPDNRFLRVYPGRL